MLRKSFTRITSRVFVPRISTPVIHSSFRSFSQTEPKPDATLKADDSASINVQPIDVQPVVEETTSNTTTASTSIDNIDINQILKDLDLTSLSETIANPPPLQSIYDHVGPLTTSVLLQLSDSDFRILIPNVLARNKLKEHLRILTGNHIAADGTQVNTPELKVTEADAAKETTSASIKPLILPELLPGVNEAIIVEWKVKVGEHFMRGQPLCEIDMDLAVIDYEAEEPGHLSEILIKNGEPVKAGESIAVQTYQEK